MDLENEWEIEVISQRDMEPISQMIPFVELKHADLPGVSVFDMGNTLKSLLMTHGFH